MPVARLHLGIATLGTLLLITTPAHPQSITKGTVEGTVSDVTGAPFSEARVYATERGTGVSRTTYTNPNGQFRFSFLHPGNYDITFEELGFQPVRLESVSVLPASVQRIAVVLRPTELPVHTIETDEFRETVEMSRVGVSQWFSSFEMDELPDQRRELTQLARFSPVSSSRLDTERLPGWLSGFAVDGILYEPSRHPDLPSSHLDAVALPLSGFSSAELLTNPLDVEFSEFAGSYLSGHSRRGTARPEVHGYFDWTGGVVTNSAHFSGPDAGGHSFRLGGLLSGPIIRDTAHYVLGFEGQRLETPLPPAWANNTLNQDLVAAAEALGVNIRPYTADRLRSIDIASAFGRFDWQVTQNHAISVRGNLGVFQTGGERNGRLFDPGLSVPLIASLGAEVEGADLSGGGTLASILGRVVASELRVGVERSDRNYKRTTPAGTRIVDGGLAFGMDPTLPAEVKRFAVRASETLHFTLRRHQLKLGIGGLFTSFDHRYTFARDGIFGFSGPEEFAALTGTFGQASGTAPFARYRNWQLALFAQDVWNAAPGLEVLLGLRYEREFLDRDALSLDPVWQARTGLANNSFNKGLDKFSPRFGFRWDISQRGEWIIRGSAGLYHNLVPPAVFGELVTQGGSVLTRHGAGALDSWPDAPGLAAAPTIGPRLSLLGPDFGPPRTGRASLGLSRLFVDGTALHVYGAYRYTDFLPRRKDINLALAPTGKDQYGRPIYGSLSKQGGLLAVQRATNRRFPDYSLVSAIDADGVSKHWDATVRLERHHGDWLNLLAAYSLSWGEDNWLAPNGGGPDLQLNPFPDGLDGADWSEGRSDLDVPHRLITGAQLKFESDVVAVHVGAFYRLQSGQPFTPGFRAGVDANGDGSTRNDPAYIDDTIAGMEALLKGWSCLADQVGTFAERNSCRGPSRSFLDLRVEFSLGTAGRRGLSLIVDALNVLDTDTGTRDAALLLVDRERDLETAPDGTVTVPLLANPNFGKALVRHTTGRALRFGLRVGV